MANFLKERITTGWQKYVCQECTGLAAQYRQFQTRTQSETLPFTPLAGTQAAIEVQMGDLGSKVARKEQQLRQQVKQFLQVTAERLSLTSV